jgi:type IV pilus assembly protein PilA
MSERKGAPVVTILVIIAIIVVAAAIAVPAWKNHQASARVSDALKTTQAAKLVVMEAATTRGGVANIQRGDVGYNASAMSSPYASSVTIADGGRITLSTRNTGADPDPVLLLTPSDDGKAGGSGSITWNCSVVTGDADALSDVCKTTAPAAATTTAPAATASQEPVTSGSAVKPQPAAAATAPAH